MNSTAEKMGLRLGKQKTTRDARMLRFGTYVTDIAALERQMARTYNAFTAVEKVGTWPMYGNDKLGDCVVAGAAHQVQQWRARAAGEPAPITDQEVIESYFRASGGTGPAPTSYDDYARRYSHLDQGLDPLAYLKQWQSVGIGGHKVAAYVQLDPGNVTELRLAAWLFDGLYIGLELPYAIAQDPFAPWVMHTRSLSGNWRPGSWGGHMVQASYTNPDGGYLETWGQRVRYSWAFLRAYADVFFGVLSADDIDQATQMAPSGFAMAALLDDVRALAA